VRLLRLDGDIKSFVLDYYQIRLNESLFNFLSHLLSSRFSRIVCIDVGQVGNDKGESVDIGILR